MDLRERAVERVQAGESVRAVAEVLDISPSSVVKWWQRFRATGSFAAGKIGGYRPRVLVGEHRAWLVKRIAGADFTLRGLVAELAERGLKVDYRTMWKFVHAEDMSFKKNRARRRTAKAGRRQPARLVEEISRQA